MTTEPRPPVLPRDDQQARITHAFAGSLGDGLLKLELSRLSSELYDFRSKSATGVSQMAPRQNRCIPKHHEDSYRRIQAVGGEALPLNGANLAHVLSDDDCLVFYKGRANQIMASKMGVSVLSG